MDSDFTKEQIRKYKEIKKFLAKRKVKKGEAEGVRKIGVPLGAPVESEFTKKKR